MKMLALNNHIAL